MECIVSPAEIIPKHPAAEAFLLFLWARCRRIFIGRLIAFIDAVILNHQKLIARSTQIIEVRGIRGIANVLDVVVVAVRLTSRVATVAAQSIAGCGVDGDHGGACISASSLTTLQHMSRCSQDRLKNRKMKTMGGTHDVEYFSK